MFTVIPCGKSDRDAVVDAFTGKTRALLLHCEGSNGATDFPNSAYDSAGEIAAAIGRTAKARGNAQVSTAQYKFGSASLLLDGNDSLIASIPPIGKQAFTIDFQIRITSTAQSNEPLSIGPGSSAALNEGLLIIASHVTAGLNYLGLYNAGSLRIQHTGPLSTNTWYHVAIVGNGGADGSRTIKMYLDGTQIGSTWTTNYNILSQSITIGTNEVVQAEGAVGNMDEIRVLIGEQGWTENFTAPTGPYS